jgi:hypothetical protein
MSETTGNIPHYPQDDFDKSPEVMTETERINATLVMISRYGENDGDRHKKWLLDQSVRILTGCPIVKSEVFLDASQNPYTFDDLGESEAYKTFVAEHNNGEEGPDTYDWDIGISP